MKKAKAVKYLEDKLREINKLPEGIKLQPINVSIQEVSKCPLCGIYEGKVYKIGYAMGYSTANCKCGYSYSD